MREEEEKLKEGEEVGKKERRPGERRSVQEREERRRKNVRRGRKIDKIKNYQKRIVGFSHTRTHIHTKGEQRKIKDKMIT